MTSAPHEDDKRLMLLVRDGDREAFEALVNRHKQAVINLIYRTLPDAAEAEDLAQQVFLQVYKSAKRYRPTAKFTTWLFTIARNLCLNEIRRRSRHPTEPLDSPDHWQQPTRPLHGAAIESPPEHVLHAELEQKISLCIASLPESQRTALQLYCGEELSYEEISKILDCSLSATKSILHRARETLKLRLKPYLRTGTWIGAEK